MKLRVVEVGELRVTYYAQGDGEQLVILLHGFPDDAASMLPLLEALATPERTLVAPYLRGYGPTSRAPDGRYFLADLARDVVGLIEALGHEHAVVLGHDWGALAGYCAAILAPHRVSCLAAMSVPPPRVFLANLPRAPKQLARSWYILWFQTRGLAERSLLVRDAALIETLWRLWSPNWRWRPPRLAKVKHTFARYGTTRAALRYYRALLSGALTDTPAWRESLAIALQPIPVPLLVIAGEEDGCIGAELYARLGDGVEPSQPWSLMMLPGCGHFPQHEALEEVAAALDALCHDAHPHATAHDHCAAQQ